MGTTTHPAGWKSVRGDIVDVVYAIRKKEDVKKKYKRSLKKILAVMAISTAAAALIIAGFKRHPELAKPYLAAAKKDGDAEFVDLAQSVKASVEETRASSIPWSKKHRTIYTTSPPFTANRLNALKTLEHKALTAVQAGSLSTHEGRDMVWNAFRPSDPPAVRNAMIRDYAVKVDAALNGKTVHTKAKRSGWDHPETVYQKYLLAPQV